MNSFWQECGGGGRAGFFGLVWGLVWGFFGMRAQIGDC